MGFNSGFKGLSKRLKKGGKRIKELKATVEDGNPHHQVTAIRPKH